MARRAAACVSKYSINGIRASYSPLVAHAMEPTSATQAPIQIHARSLVTVNVSTSRIEFTVGSSVSAKPAMIGHLEIRHAREKHKLSPLPSSRRSVANAIAAR